MRLQLNSAMPIPVTAIGGISDTEMATPGRVSFSCGFTSAKLAAKPAMIATTSDIKLGCAREAISGVISLNWVEKTSEAKKDAVTPNKRDFVNVQNEREITS